MNTRRARIVVTGVGLVTPIGVGRDEVWNALLEGHSGIAPVTSFDTSRHSANLGGEVKNFNAEPFFERMAPDSVGRATQMAVCAARQAVADAGMDDVDRERVGVAMGTTSGEPGLVEMFSDRYLDDGLDQIGGEFIGLYPCHVIAAHLGEEIGARGPNMMLPAACAAGNYAVGYAFDALRAG